MRYIIEVSDRDRWRADRLMEYFGRSGDIWIKDWSGNAVMVDDMESCTEPFYSVEQLADVYTVEQLSDAIAASTRRNVKITLTGKPSPFRVGVRVRFTSPRHNDLDMNGVIIERGESGIHRMRADDGRDFDVSELFLVIIPEENNADQP